MDTLAPKLFKSMIKQLITDSGSLCFSILPSALCWFPSCSHYCYPRFQGSHADLLCQRRREMWSPHLSLCLFISEEKFFQISRSIYTKWELDHISALCHSITSNSILFDTNFSTSDFYFLRLLFHSSFQFTLKLGWRYNFHIPPSSTHA